MVCKLNSIDNTPWTQAMTVQLLHALGNGDSYATICNAITLAHGVPLTRSAISGKVFRLRRDYPGLVANAAPHNRAPAPVKPKRTPWRTRPPASSRPAGAFGSGPKAPRTGDSLLDLRPSDCKWPVSSEGSRHSFCRSRRLPTRSYCAEHTALAYVRGSRRNTMPVL
jgi:hypothetical protein